MEGHEAAIFDPVVASPPRAAHLRGEGAAVIAYDERMLLHDEALLPLHPERADRLRAVMARLDAAQLTGGLWWCFVLGRGCSAGLLWQPLVGAEGRQGMLVCPRCLGAAANCAGQLICAAAQLLTAHTLLPALLPAQAAAGGCRAARRRRRRWRAATCQTS